MTLPQDQPICTAVVLAGQRPGADPLAAHFGIEAKALVPVAGRPMLAHVTDMLLRHPAIGPVLILAQDVGAMRCEPAMAAAAADPRVRFLASDASVSASLSQILARHPDEYPFLVTTADNVLLTAEMIDFFLREARGGEIDLAAAVVERRVLEAAYPGNRRTWLRFRGGAYSGANLFWFAKPQARVVLKLWQRIEQERKRGRAVIGAFGPLMLAAAGLRILSLHQALSWAGRRLGVRAMAVELPFAEACIDVDKPADHALVESILAAQP